MSGISNLSAIFPNAEAVWYLLVEQNSIKGLGVQVYISNSINLWKI